MELRAPTESDADGVAAVINAEAIRLTGSAAVNADAVRGWWTQPPPWDTARDVVIAVQEGEIVGYGDIGQQARDGRVFFLDSRGGAADEVLAELERRAAARAAPAAVVRAFADSTDDARRAVLEARGYAIIRASYRMGIDLVDRTFAPAWPDGCAVRSARGSHDEELLHDLNDRSFADHWGYVPIPHHEWLHELHHMGMPDPLLWFVAEVEGTPAGLAICRPTEYGDPDCGWVSTLGVVPAFRGRGLGSAMLTHTFATFRQRGLLRARLGVDAENTTGAVALYERAGMRVLHQSDTWERPL